jgi:hypothetical protein
MAVMAAPDDVAVLTRLLGRAPQAEFEVVVRTPAGVPMVVRNAPFTRDGTPMPTRYWLVDPGLNLEVSRLEAAGGVRQAQAAIAPESLQAAHDAYAVERDSQIPSSHLGPRPSGGVGGTRVGVKCLHAHLAYFLAGGDDPVGQWTHQELEQRSVARPEREWTTQVREGEAAS